MSRTPRGRAGWALLDQGLSSLTNFALSVAVARASTPTGFGAFGLGIALYLLALGLVRAVVAEPLLVRVPTASASAQQRLGRAAFDATLVVAMLVSVVAATGAACAHGALRTTLAALAVGMPGLLLQDVGRHLALATGNPRRAASLDALWALALLPAMGAVLAFDLSGPGSLTAAWAAAAMVAAMPALVRSGTLPRPRLRAWLHEHRALVPSFTAEFAARNASRHLTIVLIGALVGLHEVAAVRAVQVITGPATTLLFGIGTAAIPEAVRVHAEAPALLVQRLRRLSIGLCLGALAIGLAPLALPADIGDMLLGASWRAGRAVLLPQAALLASMGATTGAIAGLRVLRSTRSSLAARSASAVGGLVGGVGGALIDGANGALIGLAIANWAAVGGWWLALHRAARGIGDGAPVAHAPGDRPHASATAAGSTITTSSGIASTAVSRSAKQ